MPFKEAQQKKTHRQAEVKEACRHKRLGINAGRLCLDCQYIQQGKARSSASDTASMTILGVRLIFWWSEVTIPRTYSSMPNDRLRMTAPTQSTSSRSCLPHSFFEWCVTVGSDQIDVTETQKLMIAMM